MFSIRNHNFARWYKQPILQTRKTIFAQVTYLINTYEFKKCVNRYKDDRHAINFTFRDQFMVMNFDQFTDRSEPRDIETTLNFYSSDLHSSGIKAMPKSTLAEVN